MKTITLLLARIGFIIGGVMHFINDADLAVIDFRVPVSSNSIRGWVN
jgi:hypothetical protein